MLAAPYPPANPPPPLPPSSRPLPPPAYQKQPNLFALAAPYPPPPPPPLPTRCCQAHTPSPGRRRTSADVCAASLLLRKYLLAVPTHGQQEKKHCHDIWPCMCCASLICARRRRPSLPLSCAVLPRPTGLECSELLLQPHRHTKRPAQASPDVSAPSEPAARLLVRQSPSRPENSLHCGRCFLPVQTWILHEPERADFSQKGVKVRLGNHSVHAPLNHAQHTHTHACLRA